MEKMARVTTALGGNALTGRTMFCHLDAPANAISVCRDAAQVVVAGRNIFKIYSIEEDQFVEKLNLRVGRKPSLNFSCADVVWHQMDENLLATAATNGVVVTWNLGKPSRNKQDQLFTEHKRTVNKVCFHPTEVYMLLSGSQDGYMKCFDLRKKDSVSTFSGTNMSCCSPPYPGERQRLGLCPFPVPRRRVCLERHVWSRQGGSREVFRCFFCATQQRAGSAQDEEGGRITPCIPFSLGWGDC